MRDRVAIPQGGPAGYPGEARRSASGRSRRRSVAILFVLPAALTLLAITVFPLIYELRLVFMSWELTTNAPARFVGLQNLIRVLSQDGRFWTSMRVTAILMIGGVAIQLSIGTGLALLLNRLGSRRTLLVSLFLIPVMIAPVVAGFQFRMIYHDQFGPLNYVIELLTFGQWGGFAWIADPRVALFSILMTDVWQWTPFLMLIVLAGLQSVPVELYEAAEVDGASPWQTFWRVTVPLLLPVIIIGILIRAMDSFKLFDIIYLVTGGGPGNVTETISFYTYLQGFKFFSLGYTAAMAFIQLIIITLIAQFFLRFQRQQRGEV
ncbi:MAG: sugar ABC transporter permease [Anaerolineales bacterium]|nr:MAG: sugar ABC transporter permease [Anaerolineales bacterium]